MSSHLLIRVAIAIFNCVIILCPSTGCLAADSNINTYIALAADTSKQMAASSLNTDTIQEQIDRLNEALVQKIEQNELVESCKIAQKALELSMQVNYPEGEAASAIYAAKIMIGCGLYTTAMDFIQRAQAQPVSENDYSLCAEIHQVKGDIYLSQHLYTLAHKEFLLQLQCSKQIKESMPSNLLQVSAYQNLERLYALQGITDSIEVYQKLQEEHLAYFKEEEVYIHLSTLLTTKALLLMQKQAYVKAQELLFQSLALLQKYKAPNIYLTLQALGDLAVAQGEGDQAVSYYKDALKNTQSLNLASASCVLYGKLADCMFDFNIALPEAKMYQQKHRLLTDSLELHNALLAESILQEILSEKEKAVHLHHIIFRNVVLGIVFVSMLLSILLVHRKFKHNKKLIRSERKVATTIHKIEELKEEEDRKLFHEIIESAKSNSEEFLSLFSQGYPQFIQKMRSLDASIHNSELEFLALAFLNFSTKNIAEYTSVTTRAVEIRKNRLRKKYAIDSDVDFNQWIRELTSHHPS